MPLQTTGDPEPYDTLLCPMCGFDCTHVDSVTVLVAGGPGVRVRASGEDSSAHALSEFVDDRDDGRRHSIVLEGTCEDGCSFTIGFQQHKGATFLQVDGKPA